MKHSFRPTCTVCGDIAATIELSEQDGTWHLVYSGPGGGSGCGSEVSADRANAIVAVFSALVTNGTVKAAAFYDAAGFCIPCGKFYCPAHWSISSTGGGWCPSRHFKSLDPHWSPE